MKGLLAKLMAIVALVAGAAVLNPAPAQAADGWVYVVVNNSACGQAGVQVRGILSNVTQTGWTTSSWDNGDNIIYPRVRLGVRNQINIQARCEKRTYWWWTPVGYRTVVGYFTPTATGQTFWVG